MFELERGHDDPFRPTVMAVLDESDISARGSEQALMGSWSSCATRRAAMFSGVNSQVATATTRPTARFIWPDRIETPFIFADFFGLLIQFLPQPDWRLDGRR